MSRGMRGFIGVEKVDGKLDGKFPAKTGKIS